LHDFIVMRGWTVTLKYGSVWRMEIIENPFRLSPSNVAGLEDVPSPSVDFATAKALIDRCPEAGETPLETKPGLASACGVGSVFIKDERGRMGLGSFKALGAAYVIATDAQSRDLKGVTYVTASAGNHGLSVAAGAATFGCSSAVFIADPVPESFAVRLREAGAQVFRAGHNYEASMVAALAAADENGWELLSDSSWPGYFERPHRLMEGYQILMAEVFDQMETAPTHIFLQAGVGGLAGAAAAAVRHHWGDEPVITVVEPDRAPALIGSIDAGQFTKAEGGVSDMGRLDCKEPSLIALKGLSNDADYFATISEDEGAEGAELADENGLSSTTSGAAGLAGLLAASNADDDIGLDATSRVLIIISEGPDA
jgi:diaminopropionate ammonia-lyase